MHEKELQVKFALSAEKMNIYAPLSQMGIFHREGARCLLLEEFREKESMTIKPNKEREAEGENTPALGY